MDTVYSAVLDLDRTIVHTDFNTDKVVKLLEDHAGDVIQETVDGYCSTPDNCKKTGDLMAESNAILLARTEEGYRKGISVRTLLKEYEIEDLRSYQQRSLYAINTWRQSGKPP